MALCCAQRHLFSARCDQMQAQSLCPQRTQAARIQHPHFGREIVSNSNGQPHGITCFNGRHERRSIFSSEASARRTFGLQGLCPSDRKGGVPPGARAAAGGSGGSGELLVDSFARVDTDRSARTGFPEVVWSLGKTPEQIAAILSAMARQQPVAMATRVAPDVHDAVKRLLPAVQYHEVARIMTLRGGGGGNDGGAAGAEPTWVGTPVLGRLAVVCAGTSDLPVAEEARVTAEVMGCQVSLIADVGVAGLHRLLGQIPTIKEADAVVVVAGMDGALPSVLAGLVDAPVIAVPTSVGYGTAFAGLAPLLAALNACAPGVTVVNIDNGFGAAMAAARILRRAAAAASVAEGRWRPPSDAPAAPHPSRLGSSSPPSAP